MNFRFLFFTITMGLLITFSFSQTPEISLGHECLETVDGVRLYVYLPHAFDNIPKKDAVDAAWSIEERILLTPWKPLLVDEDGFDDIEDNANHSLKQVWGNLRFNLLERLSEPELAFHVAYGVPPTLDANNQLLDEGFMWALYYYDENQNDIPDDYIAPPESLNRSFSCAFVPYLYDKLPKPLANRPRYREGDGPVGEGYASGP